MTRKYGPEPLENESVGNGKNEDENDQQKKVNSLKKKGKNQVASIESSDSNSDSKPLNNIIQSSYKRSIFQILWHPKELKSITVSRRIRRFRGNNKSKLQECSDADLVNLNEILS